MTKILILTMLIMVSICASGQQQDSTADQTNAYENWKTLELSNYSIKYPSTWKLDQSGRYGTTFVIFSPLESAEDQFQDNINLLIQDLAGLNYDLQKYTEMSLGQLKAMIPNATLIESKTIKSGKNEYQKIVYSGDQSNFHLIYEQCYWVKNDKAIIVSFTREQDEGDDVIKVGEKILDTFVLK